MSSLSRRGGSAIRLSTRLYLGFGAIILLTLVVAATALFAMWQVDRQVDRMTLASSLQGSLGEADTSRLLYRLTHEASSIQANEAAVQRLQNDLGLAHGLGWDAQERQTLASMEASLPRYRQARTEMVDSYRVRVQAQDSWERNAEDISGQLEALTQRVSRAAANYDLKYTLDAYNMAIRLAEFEKFFLRSRNMLSGMVINQSVEVERQVLQLLQGLETGLKEITGVLPDFEAPASTTLMAALAAYQDQVRAYLPVVQQEEAASAALQRIARDLGAAVRSLDEAQVAGVRSVLRNAMPLELGVAGLVLVLGVCIAWAISRQITRPLVETVRLAEAVATGDLTRDIAVTRRDELGDLQQAMQTMRRFLAQAVGTVRSGAHEITLGASEIAVGNADLSARSEQQAASLEETAASMEHLASAVRLNTESAYQASVLAQRASSVAGEGGESATALVRTMDGIAESSNRISDIIGVIESIAFQTNILALNAAVEAARAGGQGRGFAVVAAEVRALAQRSADAAREIKTLIGESSMRVDSGVTQVKATARTMDDIVQAVQRASALMQDISAASAEQQQGIDQVNQAVRQMDSVTQQNAALVEEAAAAAASLEEQAGRLLQAVSIFQLQTRDADAAEALQQPAPSRLAVADEPLEPADAGGRFRRLGSGTGLPRLLPA